MVWILRMWHWSSKRRPGDLRGIRRKMAAKICRPRKTASSKRWKLWCNNNLAIIPSGSIGKEFNSNSKSKFQGDDRKLCGSGEVLLTLLKRQMIKIEILTHFFSGKTSSKAKFKRYWMCWRYIYKSVLMVWLLKMNCSDHNNIEHGLPKWKRGWDQKPRGSGAWVDRGWGHRDQHHLTARLFHVRESLFF